MIFFLLLNPSSAHADESVKFHWEKHDEWQVRCVYQQPDGSWSKPVFWNFVPGSGDGKYPAVEVKKGDRKIAGLEFNDQPMALVRVKEEIIFQGEKDLRILEFSGDAPVYPLYSMIPFYFPVFPLTRQDAVLERFLNGNPAGKEKLAQEAAPVIYGNIHKDVKIYAKNHIHAESRGICVRVMKNQQTVFTQYWFSDYPFPLYTVSDRMKVWLVFPE